MNKIQPACNTQMEITKMLMKMEDAMQLNRLILFEFCNI